MVPELDVSGQGLPWQTLSVRLGVGRDSLVGRHMCVQQLPLSPLPTPLLPARPSARQMDPLIDKCVVYIAEHLPEVTALPVDLSCLAEPLLLGVAAQCTEDSLEAVRSYVRPAPPTSSLPCHDATHAPC